MIVVIGPDRPPVLAESGDCTKFHVLHVGGDLHGALVSLEGFLGDDGDARVGLSWVQANCTAPAEALNDMLAYAASKNWLEADRTLIVAHVEAP